MLVLTRRRGERIIIDGNVTVEVLDVRGDQVRLGITAPKDVAVHRQEILDSLRKETKRNESELRDGGSDGEAVHPRP
jgi:carbon storage regulator